MAVVETQVVIIGAGISGLKAANDLHLHGVSLEVLEGRDRIGGRLHSVDFDRGKKKVDLGASWFHDTLSNELFDEVVAEGVSNLYYDDSSPILLTKDGVLHDGKAKISQVTSEMIKFIELQYFENLDQRDVSLRSKLIEYCYKQRRLLTDDQINFSPQLLRYLELWHGVGWNSMSSKFAMVDNVGRNCLITDGYISVIDKIMASIPSQNVHLATVVNRITKIRNNKIVVSTTTGDEYHCDYCIVTVPQSVLQLEAGEVAGIEWDPPLPSRITNSLKMMHFGSLGKFIFEFDELFWDGESTDRFISLGNPDLHVLEQLRKDQMPQVEDFIPDSDILPSTWDSPVLILNLYTSYGIPALLAFTQGELTRHLEENVSLAWDHMKPIVCKLAGKDDVPDPVNVIGSSWTKDPFSRGSYAACHPGDDPTDLIIQLSKGMDRIRFAGEHTILDGAGAVHGAWMSGRREAEHVLIKLGLKEGELDEFY